MWWGYVAWHWDIVWLTAVTSTSGLKPSSDTPGMQVAPEAQKTKVLQQVWGSLSCQPHSTTTYRALRT